MQPVSANYRTAITSGFRISATVNITDPTTGQVLLTLPVTDAKVTVSRTAAQRRTVAITAQVMADTGVIPTSAASVSAPFGNEIRPYFGVVYPDGTIEQIPMGVFVLTDSVVLDTGNDVTLSFSGSDRSWGVSQRKFLNPYTAPPEDIAAAIQAVLTAQYPTLPALNMAATGFTVPVGTVFREGDDPWAACLTLADAAGCELFMDVNGIPTGRPTPNPATLTPVWAYGDGQLPGLVTVQRSFTRQGVSNDFVVSGAGTTVQPPVRGEASNTVAGTPTYVSGPFGDIPTFTTSSLVSTSAQAQTAAQNQLTVANNQIETMQATVWPNPAFDIDDVVFINRNRIGMSGNYVIDTASLSLRHDTLTTITGRKVG